MSAKYRLSLRAVCLGALFSPLFCGMPATADESAATTKIREELKKPTTFEFSETPLKDIVAFLKKLHDINIEFDRKALDDVQINPDETLITRQLKGVSLRSALNLVLEQLDLTYVIENEVLLVTTPDRVRARAVPEIFDISALGLKPDDRDALSKAVEMLLTPTGDAPPATKPICLVGNKLLVRASETERQRIADLLMRPKDGKEVPEKKATEERVDPPTRIRG
jgi:hypothetical protein